MTPTSLRWTVVNLGGQKATLLKTVLGAATCVLGFLGFVEIYRPATPEAYIECLFRTVQLLFAQFPTDVRSAAGDDIPWTLNVARFAMPALFLWFGATALVRKIRRPIGAASVGMKRGHLILTGATDHTTALMRRRKGESAEDGVILAGDEAEAATLSAGRGAVLVGDSADPETWRRAGVLRARAALILESDDRAGMAAALAVAEAARDRSTELEPIDVVCALADPDLRALVDQVYRGQDVLPGVALHIASPAEARVRDLLAREPLHRSVDVERGEPVRAAILGFGATGEALALQLARAAIVADQPPQIVVVDRQAARQGRAFRERHGRPAPLETIAFQEGDLDPGDEGEIDRLLAGPLGEANIVFVCLSDDPTSVLMAVALRRGWARLGRLAPPIRLRRHGPHDLTRQLSALPIPDVDLTRISSFGGDEARNLEALTGARLDRRARAIHDGYISRLPAGGPTQPSQRPWPRLGQAYRQANRDQADYIPLRLASLGWTTRPGAGAPPTLTDAAIERAARTEHRRWAASAELIGWRHAAVRDNARKRHPDLVPYDTLSEAAKAKDRAVVGDMVALLAQEGVAVSAFDSLRLDSADAEAIAARLASATEGPPRIISGLDTDDQVRALETARRLRPDVIWRIELDEPVPSRLEALSPDVRPAAMALIEGADQVVAASD
ncbi:RyR domain-containing protein [Brevundimonas lutea]|uniref:RyR domain-containing protein n=1 Tax=Brevundimonas lutea TaxID=2293980 RepID=UPI0013CE45BE|nr:RyR domain-containing protein [Brevundimonas lutea]